MKKVPFDDIENSPKQSDKCNEEEEINILKLSLKRKNFSNEEWKQIQMKLKSLFSEKNYRHNDYISF